MGAVTTLPLVSLLKNINLSMFNVLRLISTQALGQDKRH